MNFDLGHPGLSHRLATCEDFDAIYSIYMHKDAIPYLGFDPMPKAEFAMILDSLVATKSFYVVETDGRVRAFYRLSRQEGRAKHVVSFATFAVAPAARGSGLAREIIDYVVSRLQSDGITRVELTVEADNPRAYRFYTKLGFEQEGTLRSAYKRSSDAQYTDEIFMAKLLSC
jgi:putative acetyltransferase